MLALFLFLAAFDRDACVSTYTYRAPASAHAYFHVFDPAFVAVATNRQLEPELLKAIAWCETRLDPCAVSPTGARGLMQFMPKTFELVAPAAGARNPFDPMDSIESAGVYVSAISNHWRSQGAPLEAVVASYNAGPGAVAKARAKGRDIPAIAETQGYVACVLEARAGFLKPRRGPEGHRRLIDVFTALFRMSGTR